MYAIVEIGGRQVKVSPRDMIRVPRMRVGIGGIVELERVLLLFDGKKIELGKPYLEGKGLEAEVLRHGKEKKIVVFKKKRRKKYRRKRGHRQPFTEIIIKDFPAPS